MTLLTSFQVATGVNGEPAVQLFPVNAAAAHVQDPDEHAPGATLNQMYIVCDPFWFCGTSPEMPLTIRYPVVGSLTIVAATFAPFGFDVYVA